MPDDGEGLKPAALEEMWGLLRRIAEHPDASIRVLGLFIAFRVQESGQSQVRLTFAELEEASGLTNHPVRNRLERMEEERIIRRERRRGRPKAGERVGETRGDYYALAVAAIPVSAPPTSPNPPTRAGPTNVRPEGVTSSPEPSDGLISPGREIEPGNTDHE
jgi:hypothetical protein